MACSADVRPDQSAYIATSGRCVHAEPGN